MGGCMSESTPTYSGCPATEVIRIAVAGGAGCGGHADAVLEEVLSPPWTSEWLTSAARAKLKAFGIVSPEEPVLNPRRLWECAARDVSALRQPGASERVSEFRLDALQGALPGAAPCREPFDYFKCL